MKKRRWLWLLIAVTVILILLALVLLQWMWKHTDNTGLVLTTYQISDDKLPEEFYGFRIAQIADLHNTQFGEGNEELLSLLQESDPDIIVFTGDQIDSRRTNIDLALEFITEATEIAPCYLVNGNHEGSIPEISRLNIALAAAGVTLLENRVIPLEHDGEAVNLIGLTDPTLDKRYLSLGSKGTLDDFLKELTWDKDSYSILLAHHPEHLKLYARYGVDLALCGHAHGGQIRVGEVGLIAPHQGLFPKYDAGKYVKDNTTMIVSRGLGNSRFPWRVNNPPELVIIELTAG